MVSDLEERINRKGRDSRNVPQKSKFSTESYNKTGDSINVLI